MSGAGAAALRNILRAKQSQTAREIARSNGLRTYAVRRTLERMDLSYISGWRWEKDASGEIELAPVWSVVRVPNDAPRPGDPVPRTGSTERRKRAKETKPRASVGRPRISTDPDRIDLILADANDPDFRVVDVCAKHGISTATYYQILRGC